MDCSSVRELCAFFAGDSLDYDFSFKKADSTPVSIGGMTLTFTMKINKSDADSGNNGLQESVTFPESAESEAGRGEMFIDKSKTAKLIGDRWYQFDYRLKSGGYGYTVGTV